MDGNRESGEERSGGELSELRREIEETDQALVDVLAKRLALVDRVAAQKTEKAAPIRDRERERAVLALAEARAIEVGVSAPLVRRILEDVIAHAISRQGAALSDAAAETGTIRVAFQGVSYAYSHLAARKYLSALSMAGHFQGHRSFRAVTAALHSGEADLAFLPIENTTAGSINQVYDLLRTEELAIVGEEVWKVDHCLAGPEDVPLAALRRILSHPQGLEQCAQFLQSLPHAELVPYFDTAEALAAVAAAGDPAQAAIGSPEAAQAHGLHVLRRGISDQEENWTRFVALARDPVRYDPRVACKTSIVLTTRHERGALLRCLHVLSDRGIQLTKLESRPRPGRPWEYMFFVDFEGNLANEGSAAALQELKSEALYLKVLGSYPAKAAPAETSAVPAARFASSDLREAGGSAFISRATAGSPGGSPLGISSTSSALVGRGARSEDTRVRVGDLFVGGDGFVVMAGPCAVESREQVEATARGVRAYGAQVLRGGVFKPRTSPYSFQGLGMAGLDLLAAAGRAHGMPIVTEVLSPEQVRPVAEKADLLQIGARNMQNFELLREVGRVDRPVLLKRGPSSTIEEWLFAAEYILAQGNLAAVPVLRERTHLPVIVDPSHGTGHRAYIAPMAWAARAAGAHGLLIEVHFDPTNALSDGEQSLTPEEFGALMRGLERVPRPAP